MTKHYYPGASRVEGFYCRQCRYCGIEYFVEKVWPYEGTHEPLDCDKRPKEKEVSELCLICGEPCGPYMKSSGRCNGRCDGVEPTPPVALTPTQTVALDVILTMATSYLEDVTTGIEDGLYKGEENDVEGMESAMKIVEEMVAAGSRVKLVNKQE